MGENQMGENQMGENQMGENIKIENYGQQLNAERQNIQVSAQNVDFHSSLKDVATGGATSLPSRDIPQNTLQRQSDQEVKPNYIPNNEEDDYIGNILDREKILQENTRKQNQNDNMDYLYENLQMPVLVAIVYFIFQLPAVRKNVLSFLPSLFNKDGNPNLSGYVFNSAMFGIAYIFLTKGISYFSQ
jgi:ATP-dependent Zn protease